MVLRRGRLPRAFAARNNSNMNKLLWLILIVVGALVTRSMGAAPTSQPTTQPILRVAVIGGMNDTGFWDALVERFQRETGIAVETRASGPKDGIAPVFKQGNVDLITMHASDVAINLVADGYATDPQPWVRNDMIIVGPERDPAGIKGMSDAGKALAKIADTSSPFVVHSSLGAQEVLRNLLDAAQIELDPEQTTVLFDDRQRRVLHIAAARGAYTICGRIPFRSGKIPNDGMVVMVQGDERLRRPYLVAVANPAKVAGARVAEARRMVTFLRSPQTQAWIATFGKGKYDDQPLFFPVPASGLAEQPVPGAILNVSGEVTKPLSLTADAIAKMPRRTVKAKGHDGKEATYEGVALRTILAEAGVPLGNHQMRGESLSLYLRVEAADGYRAIFALPELDDDFADRPIILADRRGRAGAGCKGRPAADRRRR
jgi:tungstate transport system substrate-binding protein